jgi:bacterioferritin-associated ferredoxin
MYVCVCKAVTDAEVEGAIDAGALSVADVTRACRAGGDCGACHAMIHQMIERHCDPACAMSAPPGAAAQPQRRHLTLRSHAA